MFTIPSKQDRVSRRGDLLVRRQQQREMETYDERIEGLIDRSRDRDKIREQGVFQQRAQDIFCYSTARTTSAAYADVKLA